jgi:hypothetical protein
MLRHLPATAKYTIMLSQNQYTLGLRLVVGVLQNGTSIHKRLATIVKHHL